MSSLQYSAGEHVGILSIGKSNTLELPHVSKHAHYELNISDIFAGIQISPTLNLMPESYPSEYLCTISGWT